MLQEINNITNNFVFNLNFSSDRAIKRYILFSKDYWRRYRYNVAKVKPKLLRKPSPFDGYTYTVLV